MLIVSSMTSCTDCELVSPYAKICTAAHLLEAVEKEMWPRLAISVTCACMPCIR